MQALTDNHLIYIPRFSVGKLPGWAKSKIEEERTGGVKTGGPRSRWGGRGPASFSPLSSEFQPPDDDSQKDPSSLEYPRTPLLVGEEDTSMSELEHSMSPHPQKVGELTNT